MRQLDGSSRGLIGGTCILLHLSPVLNARHQGPLLLLSDTLTYVVRNLSRRGDGIDGIKARRNVTHSLA